ncbi:MAG: thymidine phosphorylase [Firmicutes bacterium]|nr:thymidine phosphorylase [Bacillota bacterium]
MNALAIIEKKRDGLELSAQEIEDFVFAYMREEIPDYQVSALLMAVYLQGMNHEETVALTEALVKSGQVLDFSELGTVVDKHSTGGVGDKTTLVLLPLAAAAGVKIAKMSGRGLGHTGGTIDKLACIPGFRTDLPQDVFQRQVQEIGVALTSQTPKLAPADEKLYSLRDVTGTVESIPLIASSVMSKKIASGAQAIVLDVKTGSGAFMQDRKRAKELAQIMTAIGNSLGRKTVALITNMDQPLGFAVGNQLEVVEAMETLKGRGPHDLEELCLRLGAEMLLLAGKASDPAAAKMKLQAILAEGLALEHFRRFVAAQGGDPAVTDDYSLLGRPRQSKELKAKTSGYLNRLDARKVGQAAVLLGAGRLKKDEPIDLTAGILLHKKVGAAVAAGECVAEIFSSSLEKIEAASELLAQAFVIAAEKPQAPALIYERIA